MPADPLDLGSVEAEIDAEVKLRSKDISAGRAAHLATQFEDAAPAGVRGDLQALLDESLRASALDVHPPVASQLLAGATAKRLVVRAVGWYMEHVARQIDLLGTTLAESVRVVGERVARLEDDARSVVEDLPPHVPLEGWATILAGIVADTSGRVLHGDAADGTVVRALRAASIDAYGVDPRAGDATLEDVHSGSTLQHLTRVPPGSLGGVILSGCTDTLGVSRLRELVTAASRALRSAAPLVIIATAPDAWGRGNTVVVADLAPGRPLHLTTWHALLAGSGFEAVEVVAGPMQSSVAIMGRRSGT